MPPRLQTVECNPRIAVRADDSRVVIDDAVRALVYLLSLVVSGAELTGLGEEVRVDSSHSSLAGPRLVGELVWVI